MLSASRKLSDLYMGEISQIPPTERMGRNCL